jgi:hypothetical protein
VNPRKVLVVDGPALGQLWDFLDPGRIEYETPPDTPVPLGPPVVTSEPAGERVTYHLLKIALFGRVVHVASCDRAVIAGRGSPDPAALWELLVSDQAKECAEPPRPAAFGNGIRR